MAPRSRSKRRLVLPLALAVTVAATAPAATGCGRDDHPRVDAGPHADAPADTPLI